MVVFVLKSSDNAEIDYKSSNSRSNSSYFFVIDVPEIVIFDISYLAHRNLPHLSNDTGRSVILDYQSL